MSEIYDILRKLGFGLFIVAFLTILGNGINNLIGGYDKLVGIFSALRVVIAPMNYINDNDAFISFIGYFFSLTVLFWSARAGIMVYKINNK